MIRGAIPNISIKRRGRGGPGVVSPGVFPPWTNLAVQTVRYTLNYGQNIQIVTEIKLCY